MKKVFVIAEAGVNHNGNIRLAHSMIDAAATAGADAVKFQTFKAVDLVGKDAPKAEYQQRTTGEAGSQLEMLKNLELDEEAHNELKEHCSGLGLTFLSTAFDIKSIILLTKIGIGLWKIPSGEVTNLPYLRAIGRLNSPVLVSTGMCSLGEVEKAIETLEETGTARENLTLLHCTTEYPAPLEEVNLYAMVTLGKAFGLPYGYSDHTQGISVPVAAVALGATVIEKHFTMDRTMPGPDHKASLEPYELAQMVSGIRDVEKALGDGIKRIMPSEVGNREIARKSIVAARAIQKGSIIYEDDITTKRPGTGISPMEWDRVVGSIAVKDYLQDQEIKWQAER